VDPARHQRLGELFAQVRRLPTDEQAAMLDRLDRDEPDLAVELRDLLARDARNGDTSAMPMVGALRELLAQVDVQELIPTLQEDEPHDPSSIGRYTVLRPLGEGGMGVVYLAEQDRPKRLVALKIMRQGFGRAGAALRKRFERETQLLARLEHPGIARLYDAGTAPIDGATGAVAVPFFAMEFVDGKALLEHAKAARLSARDRMRLMVRISEAVAAAHRQGVVHRDLKPSNILVDGTGQPKVLDFGVARAMGGNAAMTTANTEIGQLVGTLPYMSPEQVAGDPSRIDARCDVYALGVIAYELLTSRLPLDVRDVTVAEAARQIRDDDPRPLSSIDRSLRGDLDTIVAKALEKDRDRRYASAEAFGADIARWLDDEPIAARPASTIYQLRKFARRNRGLVGGTALAFVALSAGLVAATWGLLEARSERDAARAAEATADRERVAARAAEARAQKRFNEVRKLAKSFIWEVHDGIVDLPGSTAVRKDIVTRGLEYLDSLAEEAGDDPLLQEEISEGYLKIGQAQGYYSRGNLGDRDAAMRSFEKARAIRERSVAAHPEEPRWLIGLLTARNYIGNIHYSEGRYEQALAEFQDVRAGRERVVELCAGKPEEERAARRAVSISWQWIGNALEALKRKEECLDAAERRIAIVREIYREGDITSMRDLGVAYEKLGGALVALDRVPEGLEEYRASVSLRERLAAAHPENAEFQMDVAVSRGRVARMLLAAGEIDEAETLFVLARETFVEMARLDPQNVLTQVNLAISDYRLAEVAAARAALATDPAVEAEERGKAIEIAQRAIDRLVTLKDAGKLEARYLEGITEFEALRDAQKQAMAR
jgi:tetratricopeptide (TPR) repeat protein/predicted Ser/Thr protein kinase